MKFFNFFLLVVFISGCLFAAQPAFRIATYNSLKFPLNSYQSRVNYFKTAIQALDPDILVIQELTGSSGVDIFLDEILNADEPNLYFAAPFKDGYDTDNMVFFKSRMFSLRSSRQIRTSLRDVSEYVLAVHTQPNVPDIYIYSQHLKAGDDSDNALQRFRDTTLLRRELNKLPVDTNFFVVGDFNVYSGAEQAFQMLISDPTTTGQCFDPIDKVGPWHNNANYANVHTQATRTTSIFEGSTGGMDDRFDFILVSKALMESAELFCLPETYKAFGNDGAHFNKSINEGTNSAVAGNIATALYYASDHLPVCVDIAWNEPNAVEDADFIAPQDFALHNYPNPFNPSTKLSLNLPQAAHVQLQVYNIHGDLITELTNSFQSAGMHEFSWQATEQPSGIYLAVCRMGNSIQTKRMLLIK